MNKEEREDREANEERARALLTFYPFYFIFFLRIHCRVMLLVIGVKQQWKLTESEIKRIRRISRSYAGKVRATWIPQFGRETYSE